MTSECFKTQVMIYGLNYDSRTDLNNNVDKYHTISLTCGIYKHAQNENNKLIDTGNILVAA